jgi:hypothetical protein
MREKKAFDAEAAAKSAVSPYLLHAHADSYMAHVHLSQLHARALSCGQISGGFADIRILLPGHGEAGKVGSTQ